MTTREIKFRAWDGETMLYAGSKYLRYNAIDFDGKVCTIGDQDLGIYGNEPGVLMQYTGLKDKNGVDVFESDIVNAGIVVAGQVAWKEGFGFTVKYGKENYEYYPLCNFPEVEVIGNIYSNPELINNNL